MLTCLLLALICPPASGAANLRRCKENRRFSCSFACIINIYHLRCSIQKWVDVLSWCKAGWYMPAGTVCILCIRPNIDTGYLKPSTLHRHQVYTPKLYFFILYFIPLNMNFCIYFKCYFVIKYINFRFKAIDTQIRSVFRRNKDDISEYIYAAILRRSGFFKISTVITLQFWVL